LGCITLLHETLNYSVLNQQEIKVCLKLASLENASHDINTDQQEKITAEM
jgi:hypothetical protein